MAIVSVEDAASDPWTLQETGTTGFDSIGDEVPRGSHARANCEEVRVSLQSSSSMIKIFGCRLWDFSGDITVTVFRVFDKILKSILHLIS